MHPFQRKRHISQCDSNFQQSEQVRKRSKGSTESPTDTNTNINFHIIKFKYFVHPIVLPYINILSCVV